MVLPKMTLCYTTADLGREPYGEAQALEGPGR